MLSRRFSEPFEHRKASQSHWRLFKGLWKAHSEFKRTPQGKPTWGVVARDEDSLGFSRYAHHFELFGICFEGKPGVKQLAGRP